ncbi:cytochrome P450 52A5 [Diutina catenulata]
MWLVWLGALAVFGTVFVAIDRVWFRIRERRFPNTYPTKPSNETTFGGLATTLREIKKGNLPYYFCDLFDKYDTDTIRVEGFRRSMTTCNPDNVKAMLATQFSDFCLGRRRPQLAPLLGDGIFTLDGVGWKHSRMMMSPQFTRDQISRVEMIEPHVRVLFKHIDLGETDLQPLFFRLTMDVATEFLLGESIGSLRDASVGYSTVSGVPGRAEFAPAFDLSSEWLFIRSAFQLYYRFVNPPDFRRANRTARTVVDYYVNKVLCMDKEVATKKGYTFLVELAKHTSDPKVLRDQALNSLFAGRDTTAGLLSFIFLMLAKHPEVTAKVREEIADQFGDDVSKISFESLKRCRYLQNVINETLRLFPIVPFNVRQATRDTTLPRGGGPNADKPIFIAKHELVAYNVFAMHRSKATYGEDANEFRPERWQGDLPLKVGWAFLPFNGGPRICLGQQFALTEAAYVTVRLLQRYSTMVDHNDKRMRLCNKLTMSLMDGCNVELK